MSTDKKASIRTAATYVASVGYLSLCGTFLMYFLTGKDGGQVYFTIAALICGLFYLVLVAIGGSPTKEEADDTRDRFAKALAYLVIIGFCIWSGWAILDNLHKITTPVAIIVGACIIGACIIATAASNRRK